MNSVGDPVSKVVNALVKPRQGIFGNRHDGTEKGTGWLGLLQRPDGGVSTEITVGVPINGRETTIPLLVPTLDPAEVNFLLNTDPSRIGKIPESILQKAVSHAKQRMLLQKSPFVD